MPNDELLQTIEALPDDSEWVIYDYQGDYIKPCESTADLKSLARELRASRELLAAASR